MKKLPALILLLTMSFIFFSCKKQMSPQIFRAFGTVCFINLYGDGDESAYTEIKTRLMKLDGKFNLHRERSEISLVNKGAKTGPVEVDEDFAIVLETALKTAEFTDGSFNPALGKLINLWGINSDNPHLPLVKDIEEARAHCDWRKIVFDKEKQTVFFEDKELSLDFGAIAKGYAADEIARICEERKIRYAMIDLGGNVLAFGSKPGRQKWQIGIKNPDEPRGDPIKVLSVDGCSVVTSGIYERFFMQNGRVYHHIIDGTTGFPAESGLKSVTIICNSSLAADALSTAFFVAGKGRAVSLKAEAEKIFNEKIKLVFVEEDSTVVSVD